MDDIGITAPPSNCNCGREANVNRLKVVRIQTGQVLLGAFSDYGNIIGSSLQLEMASTRWREKSNLGVPTLTIETQEQREAVKWFRAKYPRFRRSIRASLNGMDFGGGTKGGKIFNSIKGLGIEVGESDLLLALPRGGFGSLVMEHKGKDQARKTTDEQIVYLRYHNSVGNLALSTRGQEQLEQAIDAYMGLTGIITEREQLPRILGGRA